MGFSIYDILREDGEDNNASPDEGAVSKEEAENDDFSIDTSLNDEGSNDNPSDAPNMEDNMSADGSEENVADDGSMQNGAENVEEDNPEAVETNADIFSSLSAEEQQVKIKELKKLYGSLYSSCDDILGRINDLETDEDNLESISRVSTVLYDLKTYIADYLAHTFPQKSYIENDIAFNQFLLIIKSTSEILDKIVKCKKKLEKDENK